MIWIVSVPIIALLVWSIYYYVIKPESGYPGEYKNPGLGRRKTPKVVTPDGEGRLTKIIDEEGSEDTSTIFFESEGQKIAIPHVDINRDCVAFNKKQMYAGPDRPIVLCSVDRDGNRHPDFINSLTDDDKKKRLRMEDLKKENRRLKRRYSRLKSDLEKTTSNDKVYDEAQSLAEKFARLKKTVSRRDESFFGEEIDEEKRDRRR